MKVYVKINIVKEIPSDWIDPEDLISHCKNDPMVMSDYMKELVNEDLDTFVGDIDLLDSSEFYVR